MMASCALSRVSRKYGSRLTCSFQTCLEDNGTLRHLSSSFKFKDMTIELCPRERRAAKPDSNNLQFGKNFADHMLEVDWTAQAGWGAPTISPLHNLEMHPAAKALHYATQLFEGMKAFRGVDGKLRLFRPDMNMRRMIATSIRAGLPSFDGNELTACIKKLVQLDKDWVPNGELSALYIRPTFIGTDPTLGVSTSREAKLYVIQGPVGPYYSIGVKPVSLLADPKFVRAWPGGCGDKKMGANYGPTVAIQQHAESMNCQQVLWLFGDDHQITEVGTMNIFVYLVNSQGEKELITPPLNGLILPGVIRNSLLELANKWKDFKVSERAITMGEILAALNDKRLLEVFGSGTACVVSPVETINYLGKNYSIPTMDSDKPLNMKFLKALMDIQYGNVKHPWAVEIEDD